MFQKRNSCKSWEELPELSRAVCWPITVEAYNHIYVIGGITKYNEQSSYLQVYNISNRKWSEQHLQFKCDAISCGAVADGENIQVFTPNFIMTYDLRTRIWEQRKHNIDSDKINVVKYNQTFIVCSIHGTKAKLHIFDKKMNPLKVAINVNGFKNPSFMMSAGPES